MKNLMNTNWFWIVLIGTVGTVLHLTTEFDATFLFGAILVWISTVFYHECGHWFFAKMRKMDLFMISSFVGMYMNHRWYFLIPAYISFGICGMYKPLKYGKMTKEDGLWFISGGMIFNLIAVVVLISIKAIFNIDYWLYNFAILMNALILISTAIPTKGNDGGRVLALLRGNTQELTVFNSMNYLYDSEVEAEEILENVDIDHNQDIMAGLARNIAFMEINSERKEDFKNIYEKEFKDIEKGNEKVARAFQMLYKYADGKELESAEIEVFNEQESVYVIPFNKIYNFFKNGDKKFLEGFKEHISYFPSQREDKVFKRALEEM